MKIAAEQRDALSDLPEHGTMKTTENVNKELGIGGKYHVFIQYF